MFFLLSGEGKTDIGAGKGSASICERRGLFSRSNGSRDRQIVEAKHNYSILDERVALSLNGASLIGPANLKRQRKKQTAFAGKEAGQGNSLFLR